MSDVHRFIVVGVGGVGGWLSEGLVRMLEWKCPGSALILVDGDTFEAKNKERQNSASSSGNKAEVLASKLAPEYVNTFIVPMPNWVVAETNGEPPEQKEDGTYDAGKIAASDLLDDGDIVFAVVDNFKARKDICDAAAQLDNIDVFLGGNDEQLFGSTYHYRRRNGEDVTEHPAVRHEEYVNPPDRNPGEMSCEERAKIDGGTQLIAANFGVAAWLLGQVQNTIIEDNQVTSGEIYFDLAAGLAQSFDRFPERETTTVATV